MNSTARLPRTLGWMLLLSTLLLAGCAGRETRAPQPADGDASAPALDRLDPWQPFNRKMHRFNMTLDKAVLKPVARGYVKVTPKPVRTGVSNFFGNLQEPITTINLALQGQPGAATRSLGRFLLNLTLGLGGILDPASHAGMPHYDKDFGQTLARWGWHESRYLVLPIFGPGTVRDSAGKGIATTVSPVSWLAEREGAEVSILYGVNARAGALPAEAFLRDAQDDYLLIRDAYLQRRHCQIVDCSGELPDYLLPDYEFELPDFDNMRR